MALQESAEYLPWWESIFYPPEGKVIKSPKQLLLLNNLLLGHVNRLHDQINGYYRGKIKPRFVALLLGHAREFALTHPQLPQPLRERIEEIHLGFLRNDFACEPCLTTRFDQSNQPVKNGEVYNCKGLVLKVDTLTVASFFVSQNNVPTQVPQVMILDQNQGLRIDVEKEDERFIQGTAIVALVDYALDKTPKPIFISAPAPQQNSPMV